MAVAATVDVQLQLAGSAGAWTSVGSDLRSDISVIAQYGITGNGPTDRLPGVGTLSFSLNNAQNNTGGKLGYYSPGNANCRSGFEIGIAARMAVTYSGSTFYKFRGTLDEIDPVPGQYRGRMTRCVAEDWVAEAQNQKVNQLSLQTSKRADQVIATVASAVKRGPAASSLNTAQFPFPYALDTAKDESSTAFDEISKAVRSDLGYLYVVGDQTTGGVLKYNDRRYRLTSTCTVSSASFSNAMTGMEAVRSRPKIYNRVKVTVHPRRVDAAPVTLYALDQTRQTSIPSGSTINIFGQYRDPAQLAQRVGGASMITPVSGTDYAMGTGGSDTSLTANLTITAGYGSNTVVYTLTNTSGQTGFVNLLQARGYGLYDYYPVTVSASSASSIASYGEHVLTFDLPHESDVATASAIADWYLAKYERPQYVIGSLRFCATDSDVNMKAALYREPGDVVALSETVTGLASADYFIQGVQLEVMPNNMIFCTWTVMPKLDTTAYWIMEDSTYGVIDRTTVVAPM